LRLLLYIYDIWEENVFTKLKRRFSPIVENGRWIITTKTTKNARRNVWKDIMRKRTTNRFIQEARDVHGERYDYSNVNYTNNRTPVPIICQFHGTFFQTPRRHLIGRGCSKCVGRNRTKSEFIEACKKLHGDKYDYSLVNFVNLQHKISIICPEHGIFVQKCNEHLVQKHGCPKCAGKNKTTEEFIRLCNKVHENKYDYSNVVYKNCKDKIQIICRKHGLFYQIADSHLQGRGCSKCFSIISKPEIKFLDYIKIPNTPQNRQVRICRKMVDGIDLITNTIYEFLGDYWHGNPLLFKSDDVNKKCHKTYGELYNETLQRLQALKLAGYKVKYVWEAEWKLWERKEITNLPIHEY